LATEITVQIYKRGNRPEVTTIGDRFALYSLFVCTGSATIRRLYRYTVVYKYLTCDEKLTSNQSSIPYV